MPPPTNKFSELARSGVRSRTSLGQTIDRDTIGVTSALRDEADIAIRSKDSRIARKSDIKALLSEGLSNFILLQSGKREALLGVLLVI